jgi:hypothetical protein
MSIRNIWTGSIGPNLSKECLTNSWFWYYCQLASSYFFHFYGWQLCFWFCWMFLIKHQLTALMGGCTESFLNGKDQYDWPPCAVNCFSYCKYYFYNTSYFNVVVNCTEPSPLIRVPWLVYNQQPTAVFLSMCSTIEI